MTTKNKDSLKGILKDIEQDRRAESAVASKLKVDNRKALKDLDDQGFNRIIITPNFEPAPEPETIELPTKKVVKVDPKDAKIEELKKQLALLNVEKEVPEAIEEPE